MPQLTCKPAVLTGGAGLCPPRIAQQRLPEPQGEALLSDASRPMKEDGCREGIARPGVHQATAKFFVAEDRNDGHRLETYNAGPEGPALLEERYG